MKGNCAQMFVSTGAHVVFPLRDPVYLAVWASRCFSREDEAWFYQDDYGEKGVVLVKALCLHHDRLDSCLGQFLHTKVRVRC